MLESGWLFTGLLAVLATAAALLVSDDGLAIVSGTAGALTWGVWTYGSLNVVVVGDSVKYQFTNPELTLLGLMWAIVPAYIALTGPVEIVSRAAGGTKAEDL